MARRAGSEGARTEVAIRQAALRLIARHGFEAMSMRRLAAEVGLQAAALYRYFPTKEQLLHTLMREHMVALAQSWTDARPLSEDPAEQLGAFVRNHIAFHVAARHSTQVSNLELRSLSPARMTDISRLRRAYEAELRAILRRGREIERFAIEDVSLTAMAIIQMITGVIVWFRPDERLSADEVGRTYEKMTMRLVGLGAETDRGKEKSRV